MIRVAIIGFGGIAQLHRYAYWYHNRSGMPIQLVAACDANPDAFVNISSINLPIPEEITNELPFAQYTDWKKMLDEQQPDLVDICLPTRFHESVTIAALEHGCSVLCEKPMAEDYEKCLHMIQAADNSIGKLMVGQCIRFYPQYEYLHQVIKDRRYGRVNEAYFERLSPLPNWTNTNWRLTDGHLGSCLTELNVHDIDVMQHIFGCPNSLSCHLKSLVTPYDYALSSFEYTDFSVKILSKWLSAEGKFRMSYTVQFESGSLYFDGDTVTFTDKDGNITPILLPAQDGITNEIGYFIRALLQETENTVNPPQQSAHTIYMIEKCFESAQKDGAVLEVKPYESI